MKRTGILVLALIFALPHLAEAKEKRKGAPRGVMKSASIRKMASAEPSERYSEIKVQEGESPRAPRGELGFLLSFLSGLSTSGGSSSLDFGAQGDLHWKKYFGGEFDAFVAPGIGSGRVKSTQYGGMIDVKGRLPFRIGESAILSPKAGLGFGGVGIKSSGGRSDATFKASGLYFMGGLEARLARRITLNVDYAKTLFGNGSASTNAAISLPQVDSAGFDRIRVGADYRVSVGTSVGAQFIHRGLSVTMAGTETTSTINQFLGVVTLHW